MPDIWMDIDIAVTVPTNLVPLVDATDGKTLEVAIAYNEAGMNLSWNFVTTAGVMTTTAFTPTTAGLHDWLESGTDEGMYKIEIPASGGTVNNDTEGFGWISGTTTTCLPFRGPTIGFRAAALNNALIDGGDLLDVNVTHVADIVQTGNDNGADINAILTDTGTTLDALIKDIPTTAEFNARSLVSADYTVVGDLGTVQSGDSFAIVNGDHGLVSIQDDVDAILVDTGTTLDALIKDIPTVAEFEARSLLAADYVVVGDTIAGVTLVDTCTTNTDMKGTDGANTTVPDPAGTAATPAEVATALSDINLDHLMKTAVANNADMTVEVVDGTVLSNIMSKTSDTSTFVVGNDSLEALRDQGDSAWITATGFATPTNITAGTITTVTTLTNAPPDSDGVATLLTRVPDTISLDNISDGLWDELMSEHGTSGTFGLQIQLLR